MATAVHANVMMGRHPMHMAAVPPHAHTQPHAHQVVYASCSQTTQRYATATMHH